jgi:hypothetical protein
VVKCPRCQNLVDERMRATCPLCLTPLPAPPGSPPPLSAPAPPQMPQSAMPGPAAASVPAYTPPPGSPYAPSPVPAYIPPPGSPYAVPAAPSQMPAASGLPPIVPALPGTRVSLTGEVVETSTPGSSAPLPPMGGYPGVPPAGRPASSPYPGSLSGSYIPLRAAVSPNSSRGATIGGFTVAGLYILFRVVIILSRLHHPGSSDTGSSYSGDTGTPYSSYSGNPYSRSYAPPSVRYVNPYHSGGMPTPIQPGMPNRLPNSPGPPTHTFPPVMRPPYTFPTHGIPFHTVPTLPAPPFPTGMGPESFPHRPQLTPGMPGSGGFGPPAGFPHTPRFTPGIPVGPPGGMNSVPGGPGAPDSAAPAPTPPSESGQ